MSNADNVFVVQGHPHPFVKSLSVSDWTPSTQVFNNGVRVGSPILIVEIPVSRKVLDISDARSQILIAAHQHPYGFQHDTTMGRAAATDLESIDNSVGVNQVPPGTTGSGSVR